MKFNRLFGWMVAGTLVMSAGIPRIAEAGQTDPKAAPQHFVCNTGYVLEECKEQIAVLRAAVGEYPTTALGEWTWVLVKSKDWKELSPKFGLNSYSAAFTCLEKRVTFVEEALVTRVPGRSAELVAKWKMGMKELLHLAAAHEMGHALCNTTNEDKANRMADLLERNAGISCKTGF